MKKEQLPREVLDAYQRYVEAKKVHDAAWEEADSIVLPDNGSPAAEDRLYIAVGDLQIAEEILGLEVQHACWKYDLLRYNVWKALGMDEK